jgi:predicted dehydrogenase
VSATAPSEVVRQATSAPARRPEDPGPAKAPVRAAIVGAGFIGVVHAKAVRASGAHLVGIAARDHERAASLSRALEAERTFSSSSELIAAKDVDVVHICTPNATHVELAEQALRAGKHVICEKPLATTPEGASKLCQLAREAGVVAAVPFAYRYYPMVREARERARRGELGRIVLIHGFYLQDWLGQDTDDNWRVSSSRGGPSRAFADIGVHWVDLVEFVSGHRVVRVIAKLSTVFPSRIGPHGPHEVTTEDIAVVGFETDGGAIGSVVVSQVSLGRKNRFCFSIEGTKASFSFDHDQPEQLWAGGRLANQLILRSPEVLISTAARYTSLPAGHPEGFQDSFNSFVADCCAAIRGAVPEGLPTFADGYRAAQVTAAVLASAGSGRWVDV